MKERILEELDSIETKHEVRVIFACESGSRAWGFPSADSDYDVRFIYARPRDWYLSINVERKRDVIELPIDDSLDISGWDFRKALQLFYKSNPPLLEWLGSPIIYKEKYSIADQMRDLSTTYYSPIACSYHYLHMAQGNYREYLKGDEVWVKKYFYVLRPLLAVNWLERGLGVVPMEFDRLVDEIIESKPLHQSINDLIEQKKAGCELDAGPRIPEISDYIDKEIERLESKEFEKRLAKPAIVNLNIFFRNALDEIWG